MNRRSLFGRFAAPLVSNRSAERPDYFKVHLEPLEQRQLLAGNTIYVDDNWSDLNPGDGLNWGDSVKSGSGLISGSYGQDAFGTVSNSTSAITGQHWLDNNNDGFPSHLINDAIEVGTGDGDTLSILAGTYTESDIVINKQILFAGEGTSGNANTLIVPEAVSSQSATENFGVNTHSGIIILAASVTVQQVHLDGAGNGSLGAGLNYHQGITTLYDTQNGGAYAALHAGTGENPGNVSQAQLGAVPDPGGNPNRSIAQLLIQNVRVDNVFWHGITLSANSGQQYGMSGVNAQNQVINSVVTNVGTAGNQDLNRVGILAMNLDNYPNSSPALGSVPAGTIFNCTINNAGVGAATRSFGAGLIGGISFSTVNNAVQIGIEYASSDGPAKCKVNTINFAPGNSAVGLLIDDSASSRYSATTINNAHTGVKVTHSSFTSGRGGPLFGGLFILNGPGTTEAGSIGILLTNSSSAPRADAAIGLGTTISGYATGIKAEQPSPTVEQSHLVFDRASISGNAVGLNVSGNYKVEGASTISDPVIDPGATFEAGFSTLFNAFYNSITNQTNPYPPATTVALNPPAPAGAVDVAPTVGTMKTGNFTLDSTSTLKLEIDGNPLAPITVKDFSGGSLFYTLVTQTNPWQVGFSSPGALGTWFGQTTQSGGQITIQPTATELGAVFDLQNPAAPIDARGATHLQVIAKAIAGNHADEFYLVVGDSDGTSYAYNFPFSLLNESTFTTLAVNLMAVGSNVQNCLTGLNMSSISGWAIAGNLGDNDMVASDNFGIIVDDISLIRPQANSLVDVTGTVTLNGATLSATLNNGFVPTNTQQFTLISNDASDAVVGTFAGLPEGSAVNLNGTTFLISYAGGSNSNDVVLTKVNASTIVNRQLFYKGSTKWNVTNNNLPGFSDDNAIAPDKTAYIANGAAATFASVSSYTRGINGLVVDISGPHGAITANDFIFKVGNNNAPATWATATAPTTVTTRSGSGVGGSDRIEIMWANNAIQKQWLEVIVKGNDTLGGSDTNTSLLASDKFFWGNANADSGAGDASGFLVNSTDETSARNDPHGTTNQATISNVNDFDRNGLVNSTDQGATRTFATSAATQLKFLTVAAIGPFAPESVPADVPTASPATAGGGDRGISSALAASALGSSSSSGPGLSNWLDLRLEGLARGLSAPTAVPSCERDSLHDLVLADDETDRVALPQQVDD